MKTLCMLISFHQFQLDFVSHILSRSICLCMLIPSTSSFSCTYWCDTDFRFSNLCTDFLSLSFFSLRIFLTHFNRYTPKEWDRKIEKNMISAKLLIFCTIRFRPCCRDNFFCLSNFRDLILSFGFYRNLFHFVSLASNTSSIYWKSKPKKEWKKKKKWKKLYRMWFCGNIRYHNIYPFLIAHTHRFTFLPLEFMNVIQHRTNANVKQ